ncbi:MAG: Lipid A 1-diphosphate synthase [Chlamydiae bacterium]|nr:Lipid A 1-diphosphate synthase [Chlamydiota bacterium]
MREFIAPLIVLLALISWLIPESRIFWDLLDQKSFHFLNSWVQTSPLWQNFWAFIGHRIMDWIHDLIMLLFFILNIIWAAPYLKIRKVAELIFSILFIGLIIHIVNGSALSETIHLYRDSPTMVDREAFRLSSVIEWTKVKDHSNKSFPSDHAITAILFTCLTFKLMGRKMGALALLYALFFCLPRLIAGAHWLTDTLIGSASIAIITTTIAFGTPLANGSINLIEKMIRKLCQKIKTTTQPS